MKQIDLIVQWVRRQKISDRMVVSNHLDEIGFGLVGQLDLSTAGAIFRAGALEAHARPEWIKFFLVLPLVPSRRLIPDWDPTLLLEAARTEEPPSIYLQSLEAAVSLEAVEDHRIPIRYALDLPDAQYLIYFRQYRSLEEYEGRELYNRAVYFESFPPVKLSN